jgi:hypothetical protein
MSAAKRKTRRAKPRHSDEEANELLAKFVRLPYDRGDVKAAYFAARRLYLKYPGTFEFCREYAALHGDYADRFPKARKEKHLREAVKLLRSLSRRLKNKSPQIRHRTLNELYFHSKNFLKQYRLGLWAAKMRLPRCHFSQGVGAVFYAETLFHSGQIRSGRRYAKIAQAAWEAQFRECKRNGTPIRWDYYWFHALASGFLEDQNQYHRSRTMALKHSSAGERSLDFRILAQKVRAVRNIDNE